MNKTDIFKSQKPPLAFPEQPDCNCEEHPGGERPPLEDQAPYPDNSCGVPGRRADAGRRGRHVPQGERGDAGEPPDQGGARTAGGRVQREREHRRRRDAEETAETQVDQSVVASRRGVC